MMDNKDLKTEAETRLFMAKEAEKHNAFSSAILYQEALEIFRKLNDNNNIQFCLSKIRKLNKLAQKNFKKVSVSQLIPKNKIEAVIESFRKVKSLDEGLVLFALHPAFALKYDEVKKKVDNSSFIAGDIFPTVVLNRKGDVVKGTGEKGMHELMQRYQIHEGLKNKVYLTKAWEALIEKGLTSDDIVKFFSKKLRLKDDTLQMLKVGISHIFSSDSISALHVLVPRFEELTLLVSEGLGVQTVALERSKTLATRDKMVGLGFMSDSEIQMLLGKDFCEYSNFVFFNQMGLNLRNRIAHGDVESKDLQLPQALGVLQLLLYFPSNFKTDDSIKNR